MKMYFFLLIIVNNGLMCKINILLFEYNFIVVVMSGN